MSGSVGRAVGSVFPGVDRIAERGMEMVTPRMPELPAAPLSPENDPEAQAKLAEAAQREREREARRKGKASTVLAGEVAGDATTARRSLLGS